MSMQALPRVVHPRRTQTKALNRQIRQTGAKPCGTQSVTCRRLLHFHSLLSRNGLRRCHRHRRRHNLQEFMILSCGETLAIRKVPVDRRQLETSHLRSILTSLSIVYQLWPVPRMSKKSFRLGTSLLSTSRTLPLLLTWGRPLCKIYSAHSWPAQRVLARFELAEAVSKAQMGWVRWPVGTQQQKMRPCKYRDSPVGERLPPLVLKTLK
mmetsp:Transcript_36168/g.53955  ORF Transcript_36168/g.53955 Transcript_36168/m.53955 type:complete len:209 (-) Transcript_36168:201-827(-)